MAGQQETPQGRRWKDAKTRFKRVCRLLQGLPGERQPQSSPAHQRRAWTLGLARPRTHNKGARLGVSMDVKTQDSRWLMKRGWTSSARLHGHPPSVGGHRRKSCLVKERGLRGPLREKAASPCRQSEEPGASSLSPLPSSRAKINKALRPSPTLLLRPFRSNQTKMSSQSGGRDHAGARYRGVPTHVKRLLGGNGGCRCGLFHRGCKCITNAA